MQINLLKLIWKSLGKKTNGTNGLTFDQQVKTLLKKDYAEAADLKKNEFLDYLHPLRKIFQPGDLIVVNKQLVSLPMQMAMIKLDGKTGYAYIDFSLLGNVAGVETTTLPYLIRDLEDGSALQNCSLDYCLERFAKQNRSGLTAEKGIALITQKPEILKSYKINLLGSRCGLSYIPCLWLIEGRPALGYNWLEGIGLEPGGATPSCGSRLFA
jgi:hypothetical protein